jgi:hypothetical protein
MGGCVLVTLMRLTAGSRSRRIDLCGRDKEIVGKRSGSSGLGPDFLDNIDN